MRHAEMRSIGYLKFLTMKSKCLLLFVLLSITQFQGQATNIDTLLRGATILEKRIGNFNNDQIADTLYVFEKGQESQSLDVQKRWLLILFGGMPACSFVSENILPCAECSGKSDANIENLQFKNSILSYTSVVAPTDSDQYSLLDFNLRFSNGNFYVNRFKETYFKQDIDNSMSVILLKNELRYQRFNYYDWVADKSWIDNVIISKKNLKNLNDFAVKLIPFNPSESINILLKITKTFKHRAVAYLDIGDAYWESDQKSKAKNAYLKYLSLTKTQQNISPEVPSRVYDRIK